MSILDVLSSINPLFIILAAAFAYALFVFLRRNLGWVLLAAWAGICFSLLVLPGGTSTIQEAKTLPNIGAKLACVASSVAHGAPWGMAHEGQLASCRFRGVGPENIGSGLNPHGNAGESLLRRYGR